MLLVLSESTSAAFLHSAEVPGRGTRYSTCQQSLRRLAGRPHGATVMNPVSEPEKTENGEMMRPPPGVHNRGQESTAENVRDNCFWEGSPNILTMKRNVGFLSLYQVLGSHTIFYSYQMWHCYSSRYIYVQSFYTFGQPGWSSLIPFSKSAFKTSCSFSGCWGVKDSKCFLSISFALLCNSPVLGKPACSLT